MHRIVACCLILGLGLLVSGVNALAAQEITIGYQPIYNPWKLVIADDAFEATTGYKVTWRKFDSGAKVINAMARGEVEIAMAGSSPIAAGVSRGLSVELIWIAEDIASAEALVVRDGSGISAPQDLRGKTIGVPFASTTHFHTMFALEQFGIGPKELTIRNMQPPHIVQAWRDGDIDAAFVWDPALGEIKRTGTVLITSGLLSSWGKATFDGFIADRMFAAENPAFMCSFIKTIAAADAAYRDNPEAWTAESPEVQAIVGVTGGNAADVPGVLALYDFPDLEAQASARWLGGGAARALQFTAQFLKDERKIPTVLDDYSIAVNAAWVEMAAAGDCPSTTE